MSNSLPPRSNSWTAAEDAYLALHYASTPHAELARELTRSIGAVRNRCSFLGLRKERAPMTAADVRRVREWYESHADIDLDVRGLSDELGFSRVTVTRKASEMGLTDPHRTRPHAMAAIRIAQATPRKPQPNDWTPQEEQRVRDWYASHTDVPLNRGALAETLKRTQASVAHKAQRLGLGNVLRPRWNDDVPHPRGFAGKSISRHTRQRLDEGMRTYWADMTEDARADLVLRSLKTRERNGTLINPRPKTTWKQGWVTIGEHRHYFRSKWEVNYALYLEWLKTKKQIAEWEYEPQTFWFEKIKRGTRPTPPTSALQRTTARSRITRSKAGWTTAA